MSTTPAYTAPRVCSYLTAISIGCGVSVSVPAFFSAFAFMRAAAQVASMTDTTATLISSIVAGFVTVISFLLGMAPFFGFSCLIDYVAKIEHHLATAPKENMDRQARAALEQARAAKTELPAPLIYFYGENGTEVGPFDAATVRGLGRSGTLPMTTPVYRRGDGEWKTLADFPELR